MHAEKPSKFDHYYIHVNVKILLLEIITASNYRNIFVCLEMWCMDNAASILQTPACRE